MSDSLRPHGLQHSKLPCPSPSPGTCSISCLLSQWCHPTILSSVVPFSYLQSFPASGSFLKSSLFTSGGQSIWASASASVLPMNIQDWFPSGWTGLISLETKGFSKVFSNTTVQKHQFFASGGQSIRVGFSINPSNEYSGLISFRMDWLDFMANRLGNNGNSDRLYLLRL